MHYPGDSSQGMNVDAEGTEMGGSSAAAGDNRTELGHHHPQSVGLSQAVVRVTDWEILQALGLEGMHWGSAVWRAQHEAVKMHNQSLTGCSHILDTISCI